MDINLLNTMIMFCGGDKEKFIEDSDLTLEELKKILAGEIPIPQKKIISLCASNPWSWAILEVIAGKIQPDEAMGRLALMMRFVELWKKSEGG